MSFLSLKGVGKRYGSLQVLKDIDLDLTEGEFLVLLGPSGCGKSTLLATIAGLEAHNAGTIVLDGRDVTRLRPADRDIAMVFQSYALYPSMTVAQNLAFGLEMRRVPKAARAAAVAEVAKILQIEPLLKRRPSQLSGGQRQRVAIGRALVREPKLFLFDEPLSNLDAKLRVDTRSEIKRLHMRTGTTFVYVTHDQLEAMTLATRIAVMRDGRVLQHGAPADIYRDPADVFVATFIGSPAMNLIEGIVAGNGAETVDVRIAGGEVPLVWSLRRDRFRTAPPAGAPVLVGVRPEHIAKAVSGDVPPGWVAAPVRTELVEPAGADTFAELTLAGRTVTARFAADVDLAPGRDETVRLDLGKAVAFDPATGRRI